MRQFLDCLAAVVVQFEHDLSVDKARNLIWPEHAKVRGSEASQEAQETVHNGWHGQVQIALAASWSSTNMMEISTRFIPASSNPLLLLSSLCCRIYI